MTSFSSSDIDRSKVSKNKTKENPNLIYKVVEAKPEAKISKEFDADEGVKGSKDPLDSKILPVMTLELPPDDSIDAQLTLSRVGSQWTVTPTKLTAALTHRDMHRIRGKVMTAFWRHWESRRRILGVYKRANDTEALNADTGVKPIIGNLTRKV
jgi:hypothetical protein